MSKIDDGGPAFPVPVPGATDGRSHDGGMSLRAWFAGQALAAMLGSEEVMCQMQAAVNAKMADQPVRDRRRVVHEVIAKRAVWQADAMIAALKGGEA